MSNAHPTWCTKHDCHFPESGAHHRTHNRQGLVHRAGVGDLRKIADYLISEADEMDAWRQAEIARRDQEAE